MDQLWSLHSVQYKEFSRLFFTNGRACSQASLHACTRSRAVAAVLGGKIENKYGCSSSPVHVWPKQHHFSEKMQELQDFSKGIRIPINMAALVNLFWCKFISSCILVMLFNSVDKAFWPLAVTVSFYKQYTIKIT